VLQDRNNCRVASFEGGVGIGINGDGVHEALFPERRINFAKRLRVVVKRFCLLFSPRSCECIEIVKLLQWTRLPRPARISFQKANHQAIQTFTRPLSALFKDRQDLLVYATNAHGRHDITYEFIMNARMISSFRGC
jgi:hypothetical protein